RIPTFRLHSRCDFRPVSTPLNGLVCDDESAGASHRAEERPVVERDERAGVDHFYVDSSLGELLGRCNALEGHPPPGDDRAVGALAPDRSFAEWDDIVALGALAPRPVEVEVLDIVDGIWIADRRDH